MDTKKQPKLNLAFCGNDCTGCPRYVATQSGDVAQLKEVAALWYRVGYRDRIVPPEQIACHGCASATWCRYGIRECAMEKGIANCAECDDYPCDRLRQALETTEAFRKQIIERCSKEDRERIDYSRRNFGKRENLEEARREHLSRRKDQSPQTG